MGDLIEIDGPEEIVFKGKIVEVVRQPVKIGAVKKVFEAARRSPGARLIIPSKDKSKLLITKEHRTEVNDWDYRLPGGKVFDSLDEYNQFLKSEKDITAEAKTAAIKEAKEEVGINAKKLIHFATSTCGATITWDLFYFVVDEFEKLETQELEEGENIEVQWLSIAEVKELALSGKMQEDRSAAVVLRYLHIS